MHSCCEPLSAPLFKPQGEPPPVGLLTGVSDPVLILCVFMDYSLTCDVSILPRRSATLPLGPFMFFGRAGANPNPSPSGRGWPSDATSLLLYYTGLPPLLFRYPFVSLGLVVVRSWVAPEGYMSGSHCPHQLAVSQAELNLLDCLVGLPLYASVGDFDVTGVPIQHRLSCLGNNKLLHKGSFSLFFIP